MSSEFFYDVLVDIPLPAGEGLYTFKSSSKLEVGERVLVPFGKSDRPILGYVLRESVAREAKQILSASALTYFDDLKASLLYWVWRNYLASSQPLLKYLSLKTIDYALTMIYPQAERSTGKAKTPLEKKVEEYFSANPQGMPLIFFPWKRSAFSLERKNILRLERQPLKGSKVFAQAEKKELIWAPWKDQFSMLVNSLKDTQNKGRQSLLLFPEISLATFLKEKLAQAGLETEIYFGEQTTEQKGQLFFSCQNKPDLIVLGTWLALFLPLNNLTSISVLQEESTAYKVLSSPHFNARKVAIELAHLANADLHLFSRAPSMDSYLSSYKDLHLVHRPRPKLDRRVIRYEGRGGLSPEVLLSLKKAHQSKERSLIFLNRKGYAHALLCQDCGEKFLCPNCSVAMTPHVDGLLCHYCGAKAPLPIFCPACGGAKIKSLGIGLERLETQLRPLFGQDLLRLDRQVISNRAQLEEKLQTFFNNPSSILLASSLLYGYSIPKVSLVCILNLDYIWNLPYFKAQERSYQLLLNLESVASREVILQIKAPIDLNWEFPEEFYRQELNDRKETDFPPYSRMMRLLFFSADEDKARQGAEMVRDQLHSLKEITSSDPVPCYHYRLEGKYRLEIVLRFPLGPLPDCLRNLTRIKLPPSVKMQVQLEPEELL